MVAVNVALFAVAVAAICLAAGMFAGLLVGWVLRQGTRTDERRADQARYEERRRGLEAEAERRRSQRQP